MFLTKNTSTLAGSVYPINVSYLVIAGGGSGNRGGGGGGAGGYRTSYGSGNISGRNSAVETPLSTDSGTTYTVTVGAGGAAVNGTSSGTATINAEGNQGSNSIFGSITSLGGGPGGYYPQNSSEGDLSDGGSGGGTVFQSGHYGQGTANQGFDGHQGGLSGANTWSGGGGGAGAAGNNTGTGGAGLASSITGSSVNRGGGGSPGPWQGQTRGSNGFGGGAGGGATAGTPNTGGGGGGGGSNSQSQHALRNGASGGSGVVILRFTQDASYTATSGLTYSESTDGTDKVVTFTAGTGTITFS